MPCSAIASASVGDACLIFSASSLDVLESELALLSPSLSLELSLEDDAS